MNKSGKSGFKWLFLLFLTLAAGTLRLYPAGVFYGSGSHINKILQDHLGYIWLATDNGLTRYDGFNIKTYTRSDTPSLLSNQILTAHEDSSGELWIGTNDGIQKFIRETETFETPRQSYPGIPDFSYVNSIIEDSKGNLWFTTSRSGLVCFQGKERKPVCYMTTNSHICSDKTTVVFEDKFGNIWVGSNDNGLTMFNPSNRTMINFHKEGGDAGSISGNMIYSIAQGKDGELYVASLDGGVDSYSYRTHRFTGKAVPVEGKPFVLTSDTEKNILYIGTDGNGLYLHDIATGATRPVEPDVRDFDVRHSKIHDIIKDSQGNIWAAVYQRGALIIPSRNNGIEKFGYNPFNEARNIGNEPVLSIFKDSGNALWIGTDGDGVYLKPQGQGFRHINSPSDPEIVMCIYEDSRGDVWAGAYLGGLYKYNRGSGHFQKVLPSGAESGMGTVNVISEDREGRLWIGTNGNGIYIYNPAGGATERLVHSREKNAESQICGNTIHAICFDRNGNVWIGTSDSGMTMYNRGNGKFQQYNLANRQLNNNCVYSIVEDRSGNIWASTATGLVSISGGKPYIFNMSHGIPETSVYGLLTDNDGNIWYSSPLGVNCFNIKDRKTIRHFSPSAMGCREFKRGAAFSDESGRLYFGGVGGAVSFVPEDLTPSAEINTLRFNDLTVVPKSNTENIPAVIPLHNGDEVKLNYRDNTFTVSFGAFEFITPEAVEYQIFLENYNDAWIEIPSGSQSISFAELPPGNYILHVKAHLGESEKETSLPITISPPAYKTTTAKIGYGIIIILLVLIATWIIRKTNLNRMEHKRLLQEERIKEEKLQFFTDISHEVRTPLTLILSPLASLKKTVTDKKIINTFEMMESNGQRILRLIDQVIDLRKYDNDRMSLQLSETDIREFLNNICNSFSNILAAKKISLSLSFSDEVPKEILIDRDKIDKVVFNVIANATRFTPADGSISVTADIDGNNDLRIRISDTGPGIPPDQQEAIFERFYQVKSGKQTGGTGIGLHLSKKMMKSHFGNIFVENSNEEGTTFAIIIPLNTQKYSSAEIVETATANLKAPVTLNTSPESGSFEITGLSKPHTVLLIEDDVSIINYITASISKQYNVISATDGASGLEAVLRHRPHCVVTDIMLEGTDGLEICRRIRSNNETCDIPVIIITAKASEEQRIEGLEAGADSYIVKPFNMEYLRTQISMLIHSRRVMREKFSNSALINEDVVGMKTVDEKLLSRLEAVVVEEISNPELSVQFIADKIGVSRSHLHRKLKELTNTNPVAYIKNARMKHALILLTEKGMSVSEVAFATGFNSLSHFSTVFKEFYGMSPTKFVLLNPPGNKSANN